MRRLRTSGLWPDGHHARRRRPCTGPGAAWRLRCRTGTTIHSSCRMSTANSIRIDLVISFATDRDGNIASLSAQLEPQVADIVFTRAAAGECVDPAFRAACVGHYTRGRCDPRRHGGSRGPAHAQDPLPAALPAAALPRDDLHDRRGSTAIASSSAAARPARSMNSSTISRTAHSSRAESKAAAVPDCLAFAPSIHPLDLTQILSIPRKLPMGDRPDILRGSRAAIPDAWGNSRTRVAEHD